MTSGARVVFNAVSRLATGVIFGGSRVTVADILDGTSNTYLLSEKYLGPDWYMTHSSGGDNRARQWATTATLPDGPATRQSTLRRDYKPVRRRLRHARARQLAKLRNSRHANGCQMAFCDGSVQMISFAIDPQIHGCLGNRKDACRSTRRSSSAAFGCQFAAICSRDTEIPPLRSFSVFMRNRAKVVNRIRH